MLALARARKTFFSSSLSVFVVKERCRYFETRYAPQISSRSMVRRAARSAFRVALLSRSIPTRRSPLFWDWSGCKEEGTIKSYLNHEKNLAINSDIYL